jgi:hypothetical protein
MCIMLSVSVTAEMRRHKRCHIGDQIITGTTAGSIALVGEHVSGNDGTSRISSHDRLQRRAKATCFMDMIDAIFGGEARGFFILVGSSEAVA